MGAEAPSAYREAGDGEGRAGVAGAAQGEVVAEFDLPAGHPARAVLTEAGFADPDELILRRVNTADGRKTAFINDRRVSGEVLRELSDTLVELHGQHDDRGLLNPRGHRALLDSFAVADVAAVRAAWRAQAQARDALALAQTALDRAFCVCKSTGLPVSNHRTRRASPALAGRHQNALDQNQRRPVRSARLAWS